ncbi:efflux RND transporter adaptor subunit AcrA [soil metagenome]
MGGGPPQVEVGVLTVTPTKVNFTRDLPGRVSAFRTAEVRARVDGIVQKRVFTEGSDVKAGEVLYEIDAAPYVAALNNAKGTLAKAEANAEGARLKGDRYKQLLGSKVISQLDFDDATAILRAYEADVISGKAGVESAQIDLDYTSVTSPVSGRIGASQVTEGAYVRKTDATLLATVQELDRVYVDVTQSSNELLRLRRQIADGEIQTDADGRTQVRLLLDDGTEYAEDGVLQFSDVTVDPKTSSVTLRAIFPNPRGELLPGMFVRARLSEGLKQDAILVPQLAVSRNAKGEAQAYVVVGEGGKVESRILDASTAVGNQWLVRSGLKAGDQLIVSNLQQVREGASVKTTPANLAAAYMPGTPVN